MPERYVHLVRHGPPLVDRDRPASEWPLDPAGRDVVLALRRSGRLPERATWFSSPESRATDTARLLTGTTVTEESGLRGQVRLHAAWIPDLGPVVARAYGAPDRAAHEGWEPLAATRRRAVETVRRLLRDHPRGDLVLVGHATTLSLMAAELTGTEARAGGEAAWDLPDVVTIRMRTNSDPAPLSLRQVVVGSVAVTALDTVVWRFTAQPGWVLVPAGVVAAIVALPRSSRDLGISLLGVVLLSVVLVTAVLVLLARMR